MDNGDPQLPAPGQDAEGFVPATCQGGTGLTDCYLHGILEAIPYPFFYKDTQGRFLGCNRAFEASRNCSRQELVGRTVFDMLPLEEALRLDGRDKVLMASGGSERFLDTVTNPLLGPRQVIIYKATYDHADGSMAGIVTSVMDVTEQKQAEAALSRSQELLSTISEHVTDLLAILGPDGKRTYTSPSYLSVLGYSQEELERSGPLELIHPDDQALVMRTLTRVIGQRVQLNVDCRIQHKDGRWLHFECRANPILQPTGEPLQALVVARDVTARKLAERERNQMEVQLRHAQKLESIGSLAAGIAHEINTPTQYIGDNTAFLGGALPEILDCLAAQLTFLRSLQDCPAPPAGAAAMLEQIEALDLDYLAEELPKAIRQTQEGIARVASIVRAMKDFSHPGGEGKALANLNRAIESTLTVSRSEWKYVAELESDLDPALPPVYCVQSEINQAILNLVVNAAHAIEEALGGRHTGRMGLIRVSTRLLEQEVLITVADNGKGIPESIRDRIFEPFFTTKPVGKGTGQGLAIVHAVVVEKHGGRVTVTSDQGHGTTIQVFLPVGGP